MPNAEPFNKSFKHYSLENYDICHISRIRDPLLSEYVVTCCNAERSIFSDARTANIYGEYYLSMISAGFLPADIRLQAVLRLFVLRIGSNRCHLDYTC